MTAQSSTRAYGETFKILVMSVSGSGKSTLASHVSDALGGTLIEGDDHHSPASRAKMRNGIPLDDEDRNPWLSSLGALMSGQPGTAVLSCSALKRSYRDLLRQQVPELRLVYLDLDRATAFARVAQRSNHEFPPSLVENQFDTLESPVGEACVLRVLATQTEMAQLTQVMRWLRSDSTE